MELIRNYENWHSIVAQHLGASARLISVSMESSDRRVYACDGGIAKVRKLTPSTQLNRSNTLEQEALVLKSLASFDGVPRVIKYQHVDGWEILRLSMLPALPLFDPTFAAPKESLGAFWRLACATAHLNWAGCSHGDLHQTNIGINAEKGISIFDFDQACLGSTWRCWARDFLGISIGMAVSHVSLYNRMRQVRFLWVLPAGVAAIRRIGRMAWRTLRGDRRGAGPQGLVRAKNIADLRMSEQLQLLAAAWQKAADSNASNPGVPVAYYSLDVAGMNFPGERPWVLRWEMLNRDVSFKGKNFLELGCNMGLLSTHAKLSGAARCLGLDIDEDIIAAARMAGQALGADVEFARQSLDDDGPWEDRLRDFKFISALSVMHWVRNKERLWKFLSGADELLYEGHDTEAEAEARMRQCGFKTVRRLGLTERNRPLFYATK